MISVNFDALLNLLWRVENKMWMKLASHMYNIISLNKWMEKGRENGRKQRVLNIKQKLLYEFDNTYDMKKNNICEILLAVTRFHALSSDSELAIHRRWKNFEDGKRTGNNDDCSNGKNQLKLRTWCFSPTLMPFFIPFNCPHTHTHTYGKWLGK